MLNTESEIKANERTVRRQIGHISGFNRNDVIDNLKLKINTIVQEYSLDDALDVKIEMLFDTIDDLVENRNLKLKAQCLNPTAFILSSVIIQRFPKKKEKKPNYKLNMETLIKIQKDFKTLLNNERLELEHIIRYARYWIVVILKGMIVV